MPNISRIRIAWTGFAGAPGVSTFYCLDPSTFLPAMHSLLGTIGLYLPNTVHLGFPTSGDTIDPTTGTLSGAWTAALQSAIVGSDSAGYAAPCGLQVRWETGGILDGHRLRGRTFLVPMARAAYDSDGTLVDGTKGTIQNAVNTFVTAQAANMVIWHRPRAVSDKHPVARAGGYQVISSAVVPDSVVVLRSRRN